MTQDTCKNCRFFWDSQYFKEGCCQKRPWPIVDHDWSCGEHELSKETP